MHQQYSVSVTLLLIIPLISAQLIQSPSNDSKLLRFVAQLNVSGCPIFVHDTGKPDGPHLAVEPLMCVTEIFHRVTVRYDSVTDNFYVSLAVMVTNDTILAEVQRQLSHLSPKSVKFAAVRDISVSTNTLSVIQVLGFDWTPDEAVGFLRIGCSVCSSTLNHYSLTCRLRCLESLRIFGGILIQSKETKLQNVNILLSAMIFSHGKLKAFPYRLTMQNKKTLDISMMTRRYQDPPTCKPLLFLRSIQLNKCTARVHQKLDKKDHFLIEPLLCDNINNVSAESVGYEYFREKHYMDLNVVLQDETILNAVKIKLADLRPVSVTFMGLWNAQSHVTSALSARFEIGGMMVSGDRRSGQMRVYCKSIDDCKNLRRKLSSNAFNFFKHIKWILTAHVDFQCLILLPEIKYIGNIPNKEYDSVFLKDLLAQFRLESKTYRVTIQQRKTARVSFQRNWAEYVEGFGDETDFWIGLNTIHTLSINGVTLRVEMKLRNGTQLHAEYNGFKVGDASTNYMMTYTETKIVYNDIFEDYTSITANLESRDIVTHTKNINNKNSCSKIEGKDGWWFGGCTDEIGTLQSAKWMDLKEIKLELIFNNR